MPFHLSMAVHLHRWIVSTLTLMKASLGMESSDSLVHQGLGSSKGMLHGKVFAIMVKVKVKGQECRFVISQRSRSLFSVNRVLYFHN